jgi:hypothetical protein
MILPNDRTQEQRILTLSIDDGNRVVVDCLLFFSLPTLNHVVVTGLVETP